MTKAKRKTMDLIAQSGLIPQEPNFITMLADLDAQGVTSSLVSRAAGKSSGSIRLYILRAGKGKKTRLDWVTGEVIRNLHAAYCSNGNGTLDLQVGEPEAVPQPAQPAIPAEGVVVPQVQAGA